MIIETNNGLSNGRELRFHFIPRSRAWIGKYETLHNYDLYTNMLLMVPERCVDHFILAANQETIIAKVIQSSMKLHLFTSKY